jgi:hypothetical protein
MSGGVNLDGRAEQYIMSYRDSRHIEDDAVEIEVDIAA